jgi:hypothetical protein
MFSLCSVHTTLDTLSCRCRPPNGPSHLSPQLYFASAGVAATVSPKNATPTKGIKSLPPLLHSPIHPLSDQSLSNASDLDHLHYCLSYFHAPRQVLSFVCPYNFRRNSRSSWISHCIPLQPVVIERRGVQALGRLSMVMPLSNLGGEFSQTRRNSWRSSKNPKKTTKVSCPEPLLAHKANNILRSTALDFNFSTPSTLTLTRSASGILTLSSAMACTLYVIHIHCLKRPCSLPMRSAPLTAICQRGSRLDQS